MDYIYLALKQRCSVGTSIPKGKVPKKKCALHGHQKTDISYKRYRKTGYSQSKLKYNKQLRKKVVYEQGWASELKHRANAAKNSLAKNQCMPMHDADHTITPFPI